ncbi:MAG: hypothetical protein ACRDLY_16380, partial [Thermoleophilaceae bacterium]
LTLEQIDKPHPQRLAQHPQPLSNRLRRRTANRPVEARVLARACSTRSPRLGSFATHGRRPDQRS